jgi:DNA-binding NarL/FixJ family response regulator
MILSEREREILSLAALSNKQIAKKLNLSWKTVERAFSTMFEKYGVKTRTKLLLKAIQNGELTIVDLGFFNVLGQYQEDLQIVDMRKE